MKITVIFFSFNKKLSLPAENTRLTEAVELQVRLWQKAYPQIQTFTRMGQLSEMLLMYFPEGKEDSADPISFVEQNGAAVDSIFFDVLSFEFVKGSPVKRINQKKFIYLTETLSNKYLALLIKYS